MIDNSKDLVKKIILDFNKENPLCVDMTCGNGYDSKFILENLNPKFLYAFDIQEEARKSSEKTLGKTYENFKFILDNHKNFDKYIDQKIDFAIFNLGYLPKASKEITTNHKDVKIALEKLLKVLNKDGLILITFYPGHREGKKESIYLEDYLSSLSQKEYSILKFSFINQINNPPYLIKISKK